MLHRVNPPDCLDDMKVVLKYQRKFLRLCLSTSNTLDKAACIDWFDDKVGKWTWQRIWRGGKPTTFGGTVNALVNYAIQNPQTAKTVYRLICQDQQFSIKRQSTNFAFAYPSFTDEWKAVLRPFLEHFYNLLHSPGYPADVFSLAAKLDWRAFMDAQYEKNSYVCPYCDDKPGDRTAKIDANDAEHWLPKSEYPHLSIHWANLFRACMVCNERFKGDDNPLKHCGAGELEKTYHPYDKPALPGAAVVVSIKPSNPNVYDLRLQDAGNVECADAIDSLLSLSERWASRMNPILQRDKSALVADDIERAVMRREKISYDWLQEALAIKRTIRTRKISQSPNALLESAILAFQASNQVCELYAGLVYAHP